jgi:hypothetical protein
MTSRRNAVRKAFFSSRFVVDSMCAKVLARAAYGTLEKSTKDYFRDEMDFLREKYERSANFPPSFHVNFTQF